MEVLSLAGSFEEQVEYQANVPHVSVPNEVIDQWGDWVHLPIDQYTDPVFTEIERDAMARFHDAWDDVAGQIPDPLPPLTETQRLDEWDTLQKAATLALQVFQVRGLFPEDREIF